MEATEEAVVPTIIQDKKDATVPEQQEQQKEETMAFSFQKSTASSSIPDWDHDVDNIPRLQVVDENQNFT